MAVKYFNSGFLTLAGKVVVKLTDISVNYSVDTDEVTSFDSNYVKEYQAGYGGWTASATGIVSDDSTEPTKYSGETRVTGVTNGFDLLETSKARIPLALVMKVDTSNYQTGTVIVTSYDISGALGSKMTYSLSLQGTGNLTKASS